jgi:membrane protease YdiL (CAAX protease family)
VIWVALVLLAVAAAIASSLRPVLAGSWAMWLGLLVPYVLVSALGLLRLRRSKRLRPLVRFQPGDPTLGAVVGFGLLASAWAVKSVLFRGSSAEHAWLFWLFRQVGEVSRPSIAVALIAIVVCEELTWRGWVQDELRQALGARRGWVACAGLYALAHVATLFTLRDETAGLNPLVVLAALGCGLVWGFLAERTGRILPSIFAHAVYSYFAVDTLRPFT